MRTTTLFLFAILAVSALSSEEVRACLDSASDLKQSISDYVQGGQKWRPEKIGSLLSKLGSTINSCLKAGRSHTDNAVCIAEATQIRQVLKTITSAIKRLNYNKAKEAYQTFVEDLKQAKVDCK